MRQRPASNPTAILASLLSKREKLQEELRSIEKQVYELETSYLQDSTQCGNVLKGFEGFLSSSKSTTKYVTCLRNMLNGFNGPFITWWHWVSFGSL
ncbi:chromatin modification-related protein MEAF6 isoform X2 [Amborella trichopoda]|uniref:chromatin modification-related protein MEAF6 isoform X2 n=1 Tax=Amborella trichopoda TaxID=13333 RepID=UPI0009BFB62B|nr:chromatin modification-related protein MEAF6 isoform X2 [Amborella trichopoda]|eukprot:XP_020524372.1 chromatin modification-related protein MEAF6 isoform X2 [Amborella trichopoda]